MRHICGRSHVTTEEETRDITRQPLSGAAVVSTGEEEATR
jgi:hypothetical protein